MCECEKVKKNQIWHPKLEPVTFKQKDIHLNVTSHHQDSDATFGTP